MEVLLKLHDQSKSKTRKLLFYHIKYWVYFIQFALSDTMKLVFDWLRRWLEICWSFVIFLIRFREEEVFEFFNLIWFTLLLYCSFTFVLLKTEQKTYVTHFMYVGYSLPEHVSVYLSIACFIVDFELTLCLQFCWSAELVKWFEWHPSVHPSVHPSTCGVRFVAVMLSQYLLA
jgi:hypothetical protein